MKKTVHFISSNETKVKEAQFILGFPVEITSVDLPEIQGNDIEEIVRIKALEAFKQIKKPVLVDDVGFYISTWNGFPGPLIKWLLKSGGSALILKMLLGEKDRKADFVSAIGYHDGKKVHTFVGKVSGIIPDEPKSTRKAPELETIFVPDGHTSTNAGGRIHKRGTTETLDAIGKKQAKKLRDVCAKNQIEAIFTSPEIRTLETAKISADGLRLAKIEKLESLRERSWGNWEGKPWIEVQQRLDKMSLEERYTFIPPNGESWKQMEQRLQQALFTILEDDSQNIAIITHGGVLRGLMPILMSAPKESSFQYDFHNASVTVFDYVDGTFNAVSENDISHLRGFESN